MLGYFQIFLLEKTNLPYMVNLNVMLYSHWILEHVDNMFVLL